MKRREVLAAGAATAAAAAAPACTWARFSNGGFDGLASAIDIDAFVGELDRKLEAMTNPLSGIVRDKARARDPHVSELVRKSLRSLVMVSAFHDLPEEARLHPAVQSRMWSAMPDMDDAVVGMTSLFANLTPQQKRAAEQKLKADPELPMRVAQAIDREAERVGLNTSGRGRLRGMATTLSWRLRHQPASLVFNDYAGRMERIVARRGSEAQRERLFAMEIAQTSFWSSLAGQVETSTVPSEAPARADKEDAGNDLLLGVLALGLGVGACAGGYAIIASGVLGLLGATIGGLVFLLGVAMIVGGIVSLIAAAVDKATEGKDVDLPGG